MIEQSGGSFRFLFGSFAWSRSLDLSVIHSPRSLLLPSLLISLCLLSLRRAQTRNQGEVGVALRMRNSLRSRGNSKRIVTVSRDTSSVK